MSELYQKNLKVNGTSGGRVDVHQAARLLADEKHIVVLGCREIPAHCRVVSVLLDKFTKAAITVCVNPQWTLSDTERVIIQTPAAPEESAFLIAFIPDVGKARQHVRRILREYFGLEFRDTDVAPVIALIEPGMKDILSERLETGYAIVMEALLAVAKGRAIIPADN